MKINKKIFGLRWSGACVVTLWLSADCAWGGISQSLYIGNLEPVLDQYGRVMIGSQLSPGTAIRSLVEVRTSTDGIIRPPATNGAAHPYNPLLSTDSVGGIGMNTATPDSGLFCMVFPNRPTPGKKIFARVFNAPTGAEATFYVDSAIATVPTTGSSLILVFGAAKPLDSGDADGDGLNNSWEKALGIDDRLTADYDGDGMSDLHEMLSGTDPRDPGSLLEFRSIRREAVPALAGKGAGETESRPVGLRWQSVPGKRYQLQYVPSLLGEQAFIPTGETVTAGVGETQMEMVVEIPEEAALGYFRVKLVREEGD